MFDVGWTEALLVAVVALVVIGPKDLPKAMRVVGYWVGRMRGVARQFRSGFDSMVREAELEEMEKRWAAENARIMHEHGAGAAVGSAMADPTHDATAAKGSLRNNSMQGDPDGAAPAVTSDDVGSRADAAADDATTEPVHVERSVIRPAPTPAHPPHGDGVAS